MNNIKKTPIDKLLVLCDEYFIEPMIQPYAGANRECRYCGATEQRDGSVDHSYSDCPVVQYQELKNIIIHPQDN